MSRNVVIAAVVGVLIVGGAVWMLWINDNDNSTTGTNESSSNQTSQQTNRTFNPLPNTGRDVVTRVEATSGNSVFEYDADTQSTRFTTEGDGGDSVIFLLTPGAYFTQAGGQWIKYPTTNNPGFDAGAYQYDDDRLDEYRPNYKGTESCGDAVCDVWENTVEGTTGTFYIDQSTRLIKKISTIQNNEIVVMNFDYTDVVITPPTDYQELPTL